MVQQAELTRIWEVDEDAFDLSREMIGKTSDFDPALVLFMDAFTMDPEMLQEEIAATEAPEEPRFSLDAMRPLSKVLLERQKSYKSTIAEVNAILTESALPKRQRMAFFFFLLV